MVRRRLARVSFIAVLLVVCLGIGCPKDPYRASLSGSAKVSDAVAEAVKVTTQYYGLGKLTDSEKATIAGYLNGVTDGNMKFRHGAEDLHNRGVIGKAEYIGLAQAFINSVPTDPLTFQYKSTDSQQKFATVLGAVKTALNLIQTTIDQAKGGV